MRIRFASLKKFYRFESRATISQLIVVIIFHPLLSLIIGAWKLPFANVFSVSLPAQTFDSNLEVLVAYAKYFQTPLPAIICVLAYWMVGSAFIYEIIYYSHEIGQKRGTLASILVLLCSVMLGFKTDMDEGIFQFLFLNDYYILHHVLLHAGILPVLINLSLMRIATFVLEKIALFQNRSRHTKPHVFSAILFCHRPVISILFFTALILLGLANGTTSVFSALWNITKGFSYQNFQLIEFLYYIAPSLFVLFFINAAWEKEAHWRNELVMFRVGSRRKWNDMIETFCLNFLFKNFSIYMGIAVLTLLGCEKIFDIQNDSWALEIAAYYGITERKVFCCIIIALFLRFLEWYLLYYIDKILYTLTKQPIFSYVAVFAWYLLEIIWKNAYLFPLGKGSSYQIAELFAQKCDLTALIPMLFRNG